MPPLAHPVHWRAPAANPAGLGLAEAASPLSTPDALRLLATQGVAVESPNCGGAWGTWDAAWCPGDPGEPPGPKGGPRGPVSEPFPPVVVWGWDQCDPQEADTDLQARARQLVNVHFPRALEEAFAARALADAGAPAAATDLVDAVGRLEQSLAATGVLGVVHAPRYLAAAAARDNLVVRSGPLLRTPLGHVWVFGQGYTGPLGDPLTLVATGPVHHWSGDLPARDGLDANLNQRAALAERAGVAVYECAAFAVTVPGPGGGGG